jgi:hypothetical protein
MAPWLFALGLCALLMVPAILRAPDDALENGHAARAGAGDADTGPR